MSGLDYSSLDFSNWEQLKSYIDDNIISIFKFGNGEAITKFINIQTKFNNNECDAAEYEDALKNINDMLKDFDEEKQMQFKMALGIEEEQTALKQIEENLDLTKSRAFRDWIDGLNRSELEIVAKLSTETGTAEWDLKDWKNKVQEKLTIDADTSKAKTNLGMITPILAAIGMGATAPVEADTSNASVKLGNILNYLRTIAGNTWSAVVSLFAGKGNSDTSSNASGNGASGGGMAFFSSSADEMDFCCNFRSSSRRSIRSVLYGSFASSLSSAFISSAYWSACAI